MKPFKSINPGYNHVFQADQLSLGLVVPIENYGQYRKPSLSRHLEMARLAEQLGFTALWVRDVPFDVPSFGDVGQTFDPFTYLGYLAGQTTQIALGVASIALPLHHPVHVAKSAATLDQLSNGRLILGVASGDRPTEYPAMGIDFDQRSQLFRDAFAYIRKAQESFPIIEDNHYGHLNGQVDILPKATTAGIPMLITGHSRQTLDWIARNGDGWMYYPRQASLQQSNIKEWRKLIPQDQDVDKPFMQPLYVDLTEDDYFAPQAIHLGFRIGTYPLVDYLQHLRSIGVNHVAINLRFNSRGIEETLAHLAEKVLPHFHRISTQAYE